MVATDSEALDINVGVAVANGLTMGVIVGVLVDATSGVQEVVKNPTPNSNDQSCK